MIKTTTTKKEQTEKNTIVEDDESTVKDDRVATFKHSFQRHKQTEVILIDQTEGSK